MAQTVENTDKVHNVPIKPGHQEFLISFVYIQRAELSKDFDVDKHCRGAYVVWELKETKKKLRKTLLLHQQVTQQVFQRFTKMIEGENGKEINKTGNRKERNAVGRLVLATVLTKVIQH